MRATRFNHTWVITKCYYLVGRPAGVFFFFIAFIHLSVRPSVCTSLWPNLSVRSSGKFNSNHLKTGLKYFNCGQAALETLLYVRLSVPLSVTPNSQCFSHGIILELSGVFTIDKSNVYAKGQCQRSKVKVRDAKNKFCSNLGGSRPWLQFEFTDGYEKIHKAWSSREEVPYFFQGHTSNHRFPPTFECFCTVTRVWIHQWL